MKKWTAEDSQELYNISGWGTSYLGINESGDACIASCRDDTQVDLRDVMGELALHDVTPPVLLRLPDILDDRTERVSFCSERARKEYDFKAENFIIYPVKVNQMQLVVREIISHGRKPNLGLEVGSKPGLHAVIVVQCQSDLLIICNGYKDQGYIELVLLVQKMDRYIFIVVEKFNEIDLITRAIKKLNMKPNLGARIKPASSGSGEQADNGGDTSKSSLASSELLQALEALDNKGLYGCLHLIHFHIGPQITKIRRIQTALNEAAQYYASLRKIGYNAGFVDCGGGLSVDYGGTRSTSNESSVSYSIQEYINGCVYTFVGVADKNDIPHSNIITESGRSLSAHHSVLVIDALETVSLPGMSEDSEAKDIGHQLARDLYSVWDNLDSRNMSGDWHDIEQICEEVLELFSHGLVDLKTRAETEAMYWSACHEISNLVRNMRHVPDELRNMDKLLADKYFCNFSPLQSLPDSWAID